ncbi:MAG: PEP-CTERM sorting domain-containing protein [Blastochloris sp.]|nr:PEP-CTERM sorting domain-containing protein [Blastochloris sp.]
MKKILLLSLTLATYLLGGNQSAKAILITGFGSTAEAPASAFTIDNLTTNFTTTTQAALNTSVAGTDSTQIFAGTFATINIAGLNTIQLTGTLSDMTNAATNFSVDLFNAALTHSRTYSGNLNSFVLNSSTTVVLTFVSETLSFNDIGGFQYTGNGTASLPVNFTFDSLEAIPEPSTYALLALGLGSLVFLRMRSKRSSV